MLNKIFKRHRPDHLAPHKLDTMLLTFTTGPSWSGSREGQRLHAIRSASRNCCLSEEQVHQEGKGMISKVSLGVSSTLGAAK